VSERTPHPLNTHINFVESGKGKVGKETSLNVISGAFDVHFKWDSDMGIPGAFYIKNRRQREFFLVSLTLEDIPNHGTINFVCNSWIYNAQNYKTERIFFANKVKKNIIFL